jgi:predicted nucleic acid-binding protein
VSSLIDTSVIVRYLTGDPPYLADLSARLIDSETALVVTDVVLLESAYVLGSLYGVPRIQVVDQLIALLRRANIAAFPARKEQMIEALQLCRPSNRVSFGDAMIWAAARFTGQAVFTLDQRVPGEGITKHRLTEDAER